jgi:hypothetical protein
MRTLQSILSICLFACLGIEAQQRPASSPPVPGPQWTQLFNGSDFTGWKKQGNEKWVVEGGAIYGEGLKDYGYLATEKEYRDFHLFLRFKCDIDGNSGIYLHTRFEGETAKHIGGLQIEIDNRIGQHTAGLYGDGKAWIAWPASELEPVLKPFDWNDLLVMVEGNRYRTRLNGVQMVDFTYPSPVATDGVISLQLHTGGHVRIRFKDIWICDLSHR